ncbi:beta strand repeat-containing protein [Bradyrhizobium sp. USDA 4451]
MPDWLPLVNWYRNGSTLDLDFYNDRYWLNGTSYSGISNFITGAGATFTRSGTNNVTSSIPPFYLDSSQGQAFVSRASTATYFNSSGVLSTAATNTARTNYTYNGSSWVNSGTLIEPAATNIQTSSGDLTSATYWNPVNCTVATGSVLGPDNSTYLGLITATATNGNRVQSTGSGLSISANTTYTFSIYASPGSSQYLGLGSYSNGGTGVYTGAIFNLSGSGSVVSNNGYTSATGITKVGANLYRAWITINTGTGNTNTQFWAGVSDGSTYALSNYPSATSGTINAGFAQVETGTVATSYIPTTSSGASRSADVYSVPNGGTYFNSSGVMKNAPANTARLDHDPSASSHPSKGILIEEGRTNLAPYSANFSSYSIGNATLTANAATSPDGTNGATLLVPNTTSSVTHYVRLTGATQTNGTTYTFSFYAKQGGYAYTYSGVNSVGAVVVDLTTCAITYSDSGPTYSASSVGNGWCRIVETYTSNTNPPEIDAGNSSSGGAATFTGNGTSGVYIWGAQIEAGAFATSYIPTSGSSVTRSSDSFAIPTGAWWNATTGTFLSWSYGQLNTNQTNYGRIVGGDYPKAFAGFWGTLGGANPWNGSTQYSINGTVTASMTTPVKMAFAWDQNSTTATLAMSSAQYNSTAWNGAHNVSSSTYSGDWTTNYIYIGAGGLSGQNVGGFNPVNSGVLRVTFFPTRMPDAAMADFTR